MNERLKSRLSLGVILLAGVVLLTILGTVLSFRACGRSPRSGESIAGMASPDQAAGTATARSRASTDSIGDPWLEACRGMKTCSSWFCCMNTLHSTFQCCLVCNGQLGFERCPPPGEYNFEMCMEEQRRYHKDPTELCCRLYPDTLTPAQKEMCCVYSNDAQKQRECCKRNPLHAACCALPASQKIACCNSPFWNGSPPPYNCCKNGDERGCCADMNPDATKACCNAPGTNKAKVEACCTNDPVTGVPLTDAGLKACCQKHPTSPACCGGSTKADVGTCCAANPHAPECCNAADLGKYGYSDQLQCCREHPFGPPCCDPATDVNCCKRYPRDPLCCIPIEGNGGGTEDQPAPECCNPFTDRFCCNLVPAELRERFFNICCPPDHPEQWAQVFWCPQPTPTPTPPGPNQGCCTDVDCNKLGQAGGLCSPDRRYHYQRMICQGAGSGCQVRGTCVPDTSGMEDCSQYTVLLEAGPATFNFKCGAIYADDPDRCLGTLYGCCADEPLSCPSCNPGWWYEPCINTGCPSL